MAKSIAIVSALMLVLALAVAGTVVATFCVIDYAVQGDLRSLIASASAVGWATLGMYAGDVLGEMGSELELSLRALLWQRRVRRMRRLRALAGGTTALSFAPYRA